MALIGQDCVAFDLNYPRLLVLLPSIGGAVSLLLLLMLNNFRLVKGVQLPAGLVKDLGSFLLDRLAFLLRELL